MLLQCSFAILWSAAAVHKLIAFPQFRQTLEGYRIVPEAISQIVAPVVVAIELLLALGCLRGTTVAAMVSAVLLLLYAGAIEINLHRGRHAMDCGCLGAAGRRGLTRALVWRNVALAVLAVPFAWPAGARTLGWLDVITIAAGVCATALLYMTVDGLIANAPRMAPLRIR